MLRRQQLRAGDPRHPPGHLLWRLPAIAGPLGAANNHLLNRNSAKCADVWYLSTADGAAVSSGNCNSGTSQQLVPTAVGTNYELVNVNSGKCLEVAGASTANGAALDQSSCNAGTNQQWLVV